MRNWRGKGIDIIFNAENGIQKSEIGILPTQITLSQSAFFLKKNSTMVK